MIRRQMEEQTRALQEQNEIMKRQAEEQFLYNNVPQLNPYYNQFNRRYP